VQVLGRTWKDDSNALRQRLGIQLQDTQLSDKLSVTETLAMFRSFFHQGPSVEEAIAMVQLGVYGIVERWPRRLPGWVARWMVQLVAIAAVVPFAMAIIYTLTTLGDAVHWTHDKERLTGYGLLTFMAILFGPWIAMGALYRHVSGQAQRQALALDLMRSQYERNAAETRLRLLHAQVEPHFLFNTLANVRELVDSGSPQASGVLDSLIAYLRAAVPRLHEREATLGQEIQHVDDLPACHPQPSRESLAKQQRRFQVNGPEASRQREIRFQQSARQED